ncbi:MAG: urease accessory protein [Granulosicoccus sp.]|jgi:urease accessory protein
MPSHVPHDRALRRGFRSCRDKMNIQIVLLTFASLTPLSVFAHHPLDGRSPETAIEGLLSGIGHPVIGMDHLAFIIAIGLLAAVTRRGLLIPVGFVFGGLAGVALHLQLLMLPAAELLVAATVIVFGALLVADKSIDIRLGVILGAGAGIFHGYAYAEAIVGANMTTLASYLVGLTLIQLGISLASFYLATQFVKRSTVGSHTPFRVAGIAVASVGTAFLTLATLG